MKKARKQNKKEEKEAEDEFGKVCCTKSNVERNSLGVGNAIFMSWEYCERKSSQHISSEWRKISNVIAMNLIQINNENKDDINNDRISANEMLIIFKCF